MKKIALLLLLATLGLGAGCSSDNEPAAQPTTPDADNTARNDEARTDALASANTPLDQSETQADIDITSSIRKSIVDDKSLSTNAHNIKIMTAGGKVTLRGPVKSENERTKIEGYAKVTAGVNNIDNLLEVEKNP